MKTILKEKEKKTALHIAILPVCKSFKSEKKVNGAAHRNKIPQKFSFILQVTILSNMLKI